MSPSGFWSPWVAAAPFQHFSWQLRRPSAPSKGPTTSQKRESLGSAVVRIEHLICLTWFTYCLPTPDIWRYLEIFGHVQSFCNLWSPRIMFASDSYKPKRTDGLPKLPRLWNHSSQHKKVFTRGNSNIFKSIWCCFTVWKNISTSYALDLGLFMLLSLFGDIPTKNNILFSCGCPSGDGRI